MTDMEDRDICHVTDLGAQFGQLPSSNKHNILQPPPRQVNKDNTTFYFIFFFNFLGCFYWT